MASKLPKEKVLENYQTIDSHSSSLSNQRLFYLFCEIDRAAIKARTSFHLDNIMAYFGCVDQVYVNVADVLTNETKCKSKSQEFVLKYQEILTMEVEKKTAGVLFDLLNLVVAFNRLVVQGLQDKLHYFFRVSLTGFKGLRPHKEYGGTDVVDVD